MPFPSWGELEIVQSPPWPFPAFSSLDETISPSFLNIFHHRGAVQRGVQMRSSRWRELVGCQRMSAQGGKEPVVPAGDQGGWIFGHCFDFVIGSSVNTNNSENFPLFPVLCFPNHLLCKTVAEFDSQKCSEALGVKYYDKRRHSGSLLHRTF